MGHFSFLRVLGALIMASTLISLVCISPEQSSAATGAGACGDLRIAIEASTANAGDASLVVLVANAGVACAIKGIPTISMLNSNGKAIAKSRKVSSASTSSARFVLPHNSVASFMVSWTDEPIGASERHNSSYLTVTLPKGMRAEDYEFDFSEIIYGDSLDVTALRPGVTP